MKEELDKFIKKYCNKCKAKCDKGIIIGEDFLRCVDKKITKKIKK